MSLKQNSTAYIITVARKTGFCPCSWAFCFIGPVFVPDDGGASLRNVEFVEYYFLIMEWTNSSRSAIIIIIIIIIINNFIKFQEFSMT